MHLLGAFYLHLLLNGHPDAKITIAPETGATAMLLQLRGEAREGDLINVTITIPWGRPDPRGPGKESMLWTFDPGSRKPVASRPPCQLQTILHRKDLHDTRHVDRTAETAAWRLDRELDRGYAEIYAEISATPLEPEHYTWDTDRPALTERTPPHPDEALAIGNAWLDWYGVMGHHSPFTIINTIAFS